MICKLSEKRKKRQLTKYSNNIVFVGVNSIAPTNWAIPMIFKEIGSGGSSYVSEIRAIKSFWSEILSNHKNISGICYFYYSLEKEKPLYPLRIFWQNEAKKVSLNL